MTTLAKHRPIPDDWSPLITMQFNKKTSELIIVADAGGLMLQCEIRKDESLEDVAAVFQLLRAGLWQALEMQRLEDPKMMGLLPQLPAQVH